MIKGALVAATGVAAGLGAAAILTAAAGGDELDLDIGMDDSCLELGDLELADGLDETAAEASVLDDLISFHPDEMQGPGVEGMESVLEHDEMACEMEGVPEGDGHDDEIRVRARPISIDLGTGGGGVELSTAAAAAAAHMGGSVGGPSQRRSQRSVASQRSLTMEVTVQPVRRQAARKRMWARERCTLWVPPDRLHRVVVTDHQSLAVQGVEWVLVTTGGPAAKAYIPLDAVGHHSLPGWASRLCSACVPAYRERLGRHTLLVRFAGSALPPHLQSATPANLLKSLRGGGPLGLKYRRKGRPPAKCLVFAWLYNLCVLLGSALFIVYAWLVIFDDAPRGFTLAVWRSYALALLISFCVCDVLVCVLVALLPFDSKRTNTPATWAMAAIVNIFLDD